MKMVPCTILLGGLVMMGAFRGAATVWILTLFKFAEQALPEDYLPADISQVQMDDIFEHVDTDSDGRISYQEFRRALSLQAAVMNHFRMEGQVQ